uniref:Uncharacterized protein n=1 Tax=Timema genevievae TaxID=629358 RepID=A0A7R9JV95_TIMGE|nr:unnamed protein product [Timema genevievae]
MSSTLEGTIDVHPARRSVKQWFGRFSPSPPSSSKFLEMRQPVCLESETTCCDQLVGTCWNLLSCSPSGSIIAIFGDLGTSRRIVHLFAVLNLWIVSAHLAWLTYYMILPTCDVTAGQDGISHHVDQWTQAVGHVPDGHLSTKSRESMVIVKKI